MAVSCQIISIPTQYVLAPTAKSLLPNFLQDHVKINPEANAVILSAPRDVVEKFRRDVAQFDIPSAQIRVSVLMVEFTVLGIPCLGLNGGPAFRHTEAFSFQIATENQEETDRYWNAIVGNGGTESECGWCKDRWRLSWQITPRVLTDALAAGGGEAKRAFEAMMTMKKIDIAAIEAALKG